MQKLLIATSLLFTACHNPNYCAGNPDNNCNETGGSNDGGVDGNESISCVNTGCVGNAAGSVCDTETRACVACTPGTAGDHSACSGTAPVCKSDACTACTANVDCPDSNTCLPTGACAVATDVAYVDASMNGDCSQASPCHTIATAIHTEKSIIRVTGLTNAKFAVSNDLTIIGDHDSMNNITSGATYAAAFADDAIVTVSGSANLTMVDIALDGTGTASGVLGNGLYSSSTGTVDLTHCSVKNTTQNGVGSTAGTTKLHRTMVALNKVSGLDLFSTTFAIDNSFVVHNGDTTTTALGGVYLTQAHGTMSYSTIARNLGQSVGAKGVVCNATSTSAFTSNILNGNSNGPYTGDCTWIYSEFDNLTTAPMGAGNILALPLFVDFNNDNFHLQANSPGQNAGDTTTTIKLDFDDQQRPMGAGPDIGADEVQ